MQSMHLVLAVDAVGDIDIDPDAKGVNITLHEPREEGNHFAMGLGSYVRCKAKHSESAIVTRSNR